MKNLKINLDILPFDVIVVGSGATGGMAALTLSEQGIRVLVIEAGQNFKRAQTSVNEPIDTITRIANIANKKHIKQIQHPGYWKNKPNLYADEQKYPYISPNDKPFLWTQGKQYGGRSLTWGGITLRLSPQDFHPSKKDGFGPNWPISYDELSAHYDFVEDFCGIYGEKDHINQVPDGNYIGNVPLTNSERFFGEQLQAKLKYPFIKSRGFDKNCSSTSSAWPRSSSIGSSLKKAIETGKVQIITNYMVVSFEIDKSSELANKLHIINTINGSKKVLDCDSIFLCASTIGTLRILMNSEKKYNPNGFNDISGKLGKFLMDHVSVCNFFSMPKVIQSDPESIDSGSLSGAGSFFIPFGSKLPNMENQDFLRGYGIWGAINRLGIPKMFQKDSSDSIGFLISHGEVLPRERNKVSLSEEKDQWGVAVPLIEFEWSDNEINMVKHMRSTMKKAIKETGGEIKRIEDLLNIPFMNYFTNKTIALSEEIPPPGYYIHEVGGAPMGFNEGDSVVDKWNRLWRCRNVYVLDGACWPTSSWQSPTLTMMAISRRACCEFKKHSQG